MNTDVVVIDKIEIVKDIFENGTQFIQEYWEKKLYGGHNKYKRFLLENVDIQISLIFGVRDSSEYSISKIYAQSRFLTGYNHPHFTINS